MDKPLMNLDQPVKRSTEAILYETISYMEDIVIELVKINPSLDQWGDVVVRELIKLKNQSMQP